VGDCVDDVDEEALKGEWSVRVVAVRTERLEEFRAHFSDGGSRTTGIMTLAVDAFAAWAVGGIASPVGFVFLRR
jgi:hypothetical protein